MAFRKPMDEITSEERRSAKGISFGVVYGKSVQNLAIDMTGGDVQRAQELFDAFFEAFPGIKTWMEEKKISGRETGKVTNIFGGNIEVTDGRSNEGEIDRHSCLHEDTLIPTLDGRYLKIKDMVEGEHWVYCYNQLTNKVIANKVSKVWKTKEVNKLIKITLDNDKYLMCTEDHKILTLSGEYKEAQNLSINDSLMPFDLFKNYESEFMYDRYCIKHPNGSIELVHHMITDDVLKLNVPNKIHRHHIDFNKDNNLPDNIQLMDASEHHALHMTQTNKNRHMYPVWNENQSRAASIVVRNRLNKTGSVTGISDPEERSRIHKEKVWGMHRDNIIKSLQEGHNKESAKLNHSKASVNNLNTLEMRLNYAETIIKTLISDNLSWNSELEFDMNVCYHSSVLPYGKKYIKWLTKDYLISFEELVKTMNDRGLFSCEINEKELNRLKLLNDIDKCKVGWVQKEKLIEIYMNDIELICSWNCYQDFVNYSKLHPRKNNRIILDKIFSKNSNLFNHSIKNIETIELETPVSVYDLNIPEYHNVGLDCGIFVHNCNYPIQSSSSMVAGYSMYNLYDKLSSNGMPGTPVGFVHDALDYTANIDDMIDFIELALLTMEDELYKELGTPMKIDYEVGVNARQLCEISSYEKTDNGMDIVLSGFQNDVMDMIEKYSNHSKKYIVQDVEVLSEKESKTSWEELYTAKGAYNSDWGISQNKFTVNLKLVNA
jgi:intein/homing endonuclease